MNGTFSVRPPQQHCQLKVFELWKLSRIFFPEQKRTMKSNLGQANSHNRSSLFFSFLLSSDTRLNERWRFIICGVSLSAGRCYAESFQTKALFTCRLMITAYATKLPFQWMTKQQKTNHIYSQWFQSKSQSFTFRATPITLAMSVWSGLCSWGWNARRLCQSSFTWLNSANIILDLHHYFSCLHKKVPSRYWQRLRNEWNPNTWRTGAELM